MRAFVSAIELMGSRLRQSRYAAQDSQSADRSSLPKRLAMRPLAATSEVLGTGATGFRLGRVTVAGPSNIYDLDCRFSHAELWTITLLVAGAVLAIVVTGAAEMWGMR